jgi:hypothetical protein
MRDTYTISEWKNQQGHSSTAEERRAEEQIQSESPAHYSEQTITPSAEASCPKYREELNSFSK